jgi:hypothetical protein
VELDSTAEFKLRLSLILKRKILYLKQVSDARGGIKSPGSGRSVNPCIPHGDIIFSCRIYSKRIKRFS